MDIKSLLQSSDNARPWGATILRIAVGVVFAAHGYQKFFVWGLGGVAGAFESMGIPFPWLSALLASSAELFGGLALIAGAGTRLAALPLAFTMLVAWLTAHRTGFFLPEGAEYVLMLLFASVSVGVLGPGRLAVDNLIAERLEEGALAEPAVT